MSRERIRRHRSRRLDLEDVTGIPDPGWVVVHAKGNGDKGDVAFHAPQAGVYSVMWKATSSAAVHLHVDITASSGVDEMKD